jgi:SAM-dependent methyltransferase
MSATYGYDRGRPLDRYYIERFLSARTDAIRGRVLEFGEPVYTNMFGNGQVSHSEILDVTGGTGATYTCRLEDGDELPSDAFDCVILTQTLQYIYDVRAGLGTLHRILKPGGTVLATVPGITRHEHHPDSWVWFWSFTEPSARRLFSEFFMGASLELEVFGNVLAATAFLYGLADAELTRRELDHLDPDYEVIIGVRAQK